MKNICLSVLWSGLLLSTTMLWAQKEKSSYDYTQPDIPGSLDLEFGITFQNRAPESMALAPLGSRVFGVSYMHHIQIGKSGLHFSPGIGVNSEKYYYRNKTVLIIEADEVTGENITSAVAASAIYGDDIKKTVLAINYLEIPLELRYYFNKDDQKRSFYLGVGGKIGWKYSSHMKIKYREDGQTKMIKDKQKFHLNDFRYGGQVRVGYGIIGAYGYMAFSELFKTGKAPEQISINTWNVGLTLSLF